MEMNGTFDLKDAETRLGRCFPEAAASQQSAQDHWAAALKGECPLMPTKELGLKTMLISEGIYLSQRLGREVTPQEVEEMSISTAVKGL